MKVVVVVLVMCFGGVWLIGFIGVLNSNWLMLKFSVKVYLISVNKLSSVMMVVRDIWIIFYFKLGFFWFVIKRDRLISRKFSVVLVFIVVKLGSMFIKVVIFSD